jgi:hypothetical protein
MNPDQLAALDPGVPLLLLPVRLETRFRSATELLIRVYPDDVHLDSHEPGLTPPEIEAGERYWRATWAAGSTAERETAWATLTGRVGPTRAAWVSRALTPTNAPGPGADPVFPTPAQQASRWTRPPLAQALPDQWIALAYRGGARIAEAHGGASPGRWPPACPRWTAPAPPTRTCSGWSTSPRRATPAWAS